MIKTIGWIASIFIIVCIFSSFNRTFNPIPIKYKLDFRTQFNQFYICDKGSPQNTGSSNFWSTDAYNDRLALDDGILGVGIQSYGHVKGELYILKTVNNHFEPKLYNHIVEGGLEIKSGKLQVLDCPNSTLILEIKLNPGKYRVRIYSWGFDKTDIDEDEGTDYYKVEIWPDNNMKREVLKRYNRLPVKK
jgi:hypothetical protein